MTQSIVIRITIWLEPKSDALSWFRTHRVKTKTPCHYLQITCWKKTGSLFTQWAPSNVFKDWLQIKQPQFSHVFWYVPKILTHAFIPAVWLMTDSWPHNAEDAKSFVPDQFLFFLNGRPLFSFNRIHYFLPTWYFFIMGPQCENRFVRACVQTVDESVLCARLKHNHKLWLATEIVTEKAVEG